MEVAHDLMFGGHLGVKKMEDRIQTNFYWPGMRRDVTSFCRSCDVCQKTVASDVELRMLRQLCSDHPRQWHQFINSLLFVYREAPQKSTEFSPFKLLYGRTVRGPIQILKELWTEEADVPDVMTSYQYVLELQERLDMMKMAQEELRKNQVRNKRLYNCKAKKQVFRVGDKVLILLPTDNNKLLMQWRGPYTA